ncbi:hypothetical protein E2C01_011571 [Portunus trituberculatus]|uniref:Uncharacterized protein n=1 Tax=Portunus trituberculatus TaxID=210409 RepID=A0A5B7DBC8_PORTR|nr:hypothetical protein [Portunus trituberculatus]
MQAGLPTFPKDPPLPPHPSCLCGPNTPTALDTLQAAPVGHGCHTTVPGSGAEGQVWAMNVSSIPGVHSVAVALEATVAILGMVWRHPPLQHCDLHTLTTAVVWSKHPHIPSCWCAKY